MKIVLSWLADFLDLAPAATPQTIEATLIQLGHEVDAIETTGATFPHVVIGKILSRESHPNADKLGVCMVDTGPDDNKGTPRQIVCGAPNARAGLTVAVALPGAVLPGDFQIKSSKIRDVQSDGMLCSQRELGMGNEHNGIWEIEDATAVIGAPLATILGKPDTVLDVALTPNRGDAFSHLGIARDLAAMQLGTLKPLPEITSGTTPTSFSAATTTPDCPQINLLQITGLTPGAQAPAHIRAQLEAAGLRPKNALVDATNYTMLALGQPTHAYDAAKLTGTTLTAQAAVGGETFLGLTDVTLTLAPNDVVITDASGVVGLGGILGGKSTAVSDETTSVVLEAAYFNPVRIALTGQQHIIHTDARQRFERGTDPAIAAYALQFCASLITAWAGGTASAPVQAGAGAAAPTPITYNPDFFTRYIGMEVAPERQREILESLGFTVLVPDTSIPAPWAVTPPTYRTYMGTPEDLTEEILRVVGYENVTPVLPHGIGGQFNVDGAPIILDRLARRASASIGFLEIITYSFIGQLTAEQFANGQSLLTLANPLAQTDMTTMRPSLLPGLLGALSKNFANSDPTPRLTEVGKVYTSKGESLMAAGVLAGTGQRHWKGPEAKPDTFAAKAAALQVLSLLGAPTDSATVTNVAPAHFHPGRSGTISVGPFTLAVFGELHPALLKSYSFPAHAGPIAVYEVYLEPLLKLQSKARPWLASVYPPVTRDLAFVLPRTVTAGQLTAAVQATKQPLIKSVEVFDHYVGDRIDPDKQSIALSLTLQSPDKTLTDADITPVIQTAVNAVQTVLGGTLRT